MCRNWKKERSNHHFPEFSKRGRILKLISDHFDWSRLAVIFSVLAAGIGFFYLIQTNFVATKGYQIAELKESVRQLQEENKQLNLKYIELQSITNLSNQVLKMELVAAEKVEIIPALGSSVARR